MAEEYTDAELKKLEEEAALKQLELEGLAEAEEATKKEYYKTLEEVDVKALLIPTASSEPLTEEEKKEFIVKNLGSAGYIPARDVVDYIKTIQSATTESGGSDVGVLNQETLTNLGIHKLADTMSIEEVIKALEKRDIPPAVKIINFELGYDIEKIPRPDKNKIYSLTTVESNIWDKPVYEKNVDTNEWQETHVLKNFVRQIGGTFNMSVTGVSGTQFRLAIWNETNNTFYNWNEFSETQEDKNTGIESIITRTGFNNGVNYFDGIIPEGGRHLVPVEIPVSGSETVYRVGFMPAEKIIGYGRTDYGRGLPFVRTKRGLVYAPPYKLTQLPQSSTTVSLSTSHLSGEYAGSGTIDTEGSLAGGLVINHEPGSILNSSTSTFGKYDIELTFSPRKEIKLSNNVDNGVITRSHIITTSSGLETEVLSMNLIASVEEGNVGKVLGTITLGKSSLRPSIINFDTADIFSTNPDLI